MKTSNIVLCAEIDSGTVGLAMNRIQDCINQDYDCINIIISTEGGSGTHSLALGNYIMACQSNVKINTINIGEVCSAGVTIFACGKERMALKNSCFGFHSVQIKDERSAEDADNYESTGNMIRFHQDMQDLFMKEAAPEVFQKVKGFLHYRNTTLMHSGDERLKGFVTKIIDTIPDADSCFGIWDQKG